MGGKGGKGVRGRVGGGVTEVRALEIKKGSPVWLLSMAMRRVHRHTLMSAHTRHKFLGLSS